MNRRKISKSLTTKEARQAGFWYQQAPQGQTTQYAFYPVSWIGVVMLAVTAIATGNVVMLFERYTDAPTWASFLVALGTFSILMWLQRSKLDRSPYISRRAGFRD